MMLSRSGRGSQKIGTAFANLSWPPDEPTPDDVEAACLCKGDSGAVAG